MPRNLMDSNPYKNWPHNNYNIFKFQKLIEAVYLNRFILLWKLALGLGPALLFRPSFIALPI